MIELYNVDCMDYMKGVGDQHFDLAIVDPPYGIGESGAKNKTRGCRAVATDYKAFYGDDISPPDKDYFVELRRVSKNQIIWGANHFMQNLCMGSSCWVVWDKQNGGTHFADCELAYTSFKTAVRKFSFCWSGMLQGDMKNKETRIHPTQKPVKLYEWLLLNYAKSDDKIIDTHGGSMSLAIAAHYAGFDLVVCEIDEYYYQKAKERIERETSQISLL